MSSLTDSIAELEAHRYITEKYLSRALQHISNAKLEEALEAVVVLNDRLYYLKEEYKQCPNSK